MSYNVNNVINMCKEMCKSPPGGLIGEPQGREGRGLKTFYRVQDFEGLNVESTSVFYRLFLTA